MKLYRVHKKQNLPISVEKAWEFLSSPANLKSITPEYRSFDIISGASIALAVIKNPDLILDTASSNAEELTDQIINFLQSKKII